MKKEMRLKILVKERRPLVNIARPHTRTRTLDKTFGARPPSPVLEAVGVVTLFKGVRRGMGGGGHPY